MTIIKKKKTILNKDVIVKINSSKKQQVSEKNLLLMNFSDKNEDSLWWEDPLHTVSNITYEDTFMYDIKRINYND